MEIRIFETTLFASTIQTTQKCLAVVLKYGNEEQIASTSTVQEVLIHLKPTLPKSKSSSVKIGQHRLGIQTSPIPA